MTIFIRSAFYYKAVTYAFDNIPAVEIVLHHLICCTSVQFFQYLDFNVKLNFKNIDISSMVINIYKIDILAFLWLLN